MFEAPGKVGENTFKNLSKMDDFLAIFGKWTQNIKKALGFPLKVDAVSPIRKKVKFQWRYGVLAHAEKLFKIPYKTCRKLIIPGPFLQNGLKKLSKSITFSTQS